MMDKVNFKSSIKEKYNEYSDLIENNEKNVNFNLYNKIVKSYPLKGKGHKI